MGPFMNEPFLVESYGSPSAKNLSALSSQAAVTTFAIAGLGYATVTVSTNGIHILDLSNLHPISSYAVGPNTQFSCPAVSRLAVPATAEPSVRCTYAIAESTTELEGSEGGSTVWLWTEPLGDIGSSRPKKSIVKFPFRIHSIYAPSELVSHVILVSAEGTVHAASARDLKLTWTSQPPLSTVGGYSLYRSFSFTGAECEFVSRDEVGIVIVTIFIGEQGLSDPIVKITVFGMDGTVITSACSCTTIGANISNIEDIALSKSGNMSVLSGERQLARFVLTNGLDSALSISCPSQSLTLRPKAFLKHKHNSSQKSTISLLSLNKSFTLVAGFTSQKPHEIILLIWDLQFNVLLAERKVLLPTGHSNTSDLSLRLVSVSDAQALLVISTLGPTAHSSILAIPLSVPRGSNIAAAVGRGQSGEAWLEKPKNALMGEVVMDGIPEQERKCLRAMAAPAAKGDMTESDRVFQTYLLRASSDRHAPSGGEETNLPSYGVPFSHQFVSSIFHLLLKPRGNKHDPPLVTPAPVMHLIRSGCVSQTQLDAEGGLVGRLLERGDWSAIESAIRHVPDIPEDILVQILKKCIIAKAKPQDQMDIDSSESSSMPPSPKDMMNLLASYPTTPSALRIALKKHLSDEEVIKVLELLQEMVSSSCEEPWEEQIKGSQKIGSTSFSQVLQTLQTVIDAFLLALLQHPPAHAILATISANLNPEAELYDDLVKLKGPLEPFVKAHAARGAGKEPKVQPGRDAWMAKRKAKIAAFEMANGPYQIEELIF